MMDYDAVIHQLSRDDAMRLVGHRAGLITALLRVRQQIGNIRSRFSLTPDRHVRKLKFRDAILRPLLDLEQTLVERIARDGTAAAGQASLHERASLSQKDGG